MQTSRPSLDGPSFAWCCSTRSSASSLPWALGDVRPLTGLLHPLCASAALGQRGRTSSVPICTSSCSSRRPSSPPLCSGCSSRRPRSSALAGSEDWSTTNAGSPSSDGRSSFRRSADVARCRLALNADQSFSLQSLLSLCYALFIVLFQPLKQAASSAWTSSSPTPSAIPVSSGSASRTEHALVYLCLALIIVASSIAGLVNGGLNVAIQRDW